MQQIKKIGVWSFVRVAVILSLVFGLFTGILSSVSIAKMASPDNAQIQAMALQSGTDAAQIVSLYQQMANKLWIGVTIFSVISGLILALMAVLIYNLTSKWWGGIKIELEK